MATSKIMPIGYLDYDASTMPTGEVAVFNRKYLAIDLDGAGWIDPRALPSDNGIGQQGVDRYASHNMSVLIVTRLEDGFRVDLSRVKTPPGWARKTKPEPSEGLEWLPVVEFISPEEPRKPDAPSSD